VNEAKRLRTENIVKMIAAKISYELPSDVEENIVQFLV